MHCYSFDIVLQEVPGEISLCFSISGCPLRCKGCHSPFLWKEGTGKLLSETNYIQVLKKYKNYATCVLFMGGEWHEKKLELFLQLAKKENYKTCLYTGKNNVSSALKSELTWLKTGKWIEKLGGLESATTNQKFIELETNKKLNHLFIKK